MAKGAQDACFADAGLAGEDDALARFDRFDEALLGRRESEILVVDLLGERLDGEAKKSR